MKIRTPRYWMLCLVLLGATISFAEESPKTPASLDSLSWLEGHWRGEGGGVRMEEVWMSGEGAVMPGVHRDLFDNGRSFFEYLRIELRPSGIVYLASPRGESTTEFPLRESSDSFVLFENPEHDFPQRIEYRRDGELLTVSIEGNANGETRRRSWQWKRVPGE
jgi:hypothetical protein